MAPRRIIRTIIQSSLLVSALLTAIFFLDSRYRVLPTSLHNRFPAPHWHHTGYVITDIQYQSCNKVFSSACTMPDDWSQIEKDVFLGQSIFTRGYVFVKRKKEEDFDATAGDSMIVDVKVGKIAPTTSGWEGRSGGIWVKRSNKLVDEGVTSVDLLFGPDAVEVRPQWHMVGNMDAGDQVKLTVRKGQPSVKVERPELRINDNMKFKIIQVSDMHLVTGVGKCRDLLPGVSSSGCEADPLTLDYLDKILEIEKPDLAVVAGDIINGEHAPDAQTALFKMADLFIRRKVPYACIFGNHDDLGNLSREQMMTILQSLPYSLSQVGPKLGTDTVSPGGHVQPEGGVGNYLLEVLAHRSHSHQSAITLYFFDSHTYAPEKMEYKGRKFRVYDWIKESQINWFKTEHDRLEKAHEKYAYMHIDMAFMHIPLPEMRSQTNYFFGKFNEAPTAPFTNSGLASVLVSHGVSIVSHGHDHTNEMCMLEDEGAQRRQGGLWMCQSGAAGFGGYATVKGYTAQRKVRLFEVDPQGRRVVSWKREFGNEGVKVDEQVLVSDGRSQKDR
ncbi:Metallo-dependent phosphatase [Terfezia boudieri ATCC MYA-4762]|uniref:Metallo-dependent phosphatase n=1 Tax=Terfezia boudieri ATCC MYA-4762 TaxID=1051890 RepID=A0A3N4M2X7_9PEZI|nr:Metallo-dependent phosphatase [Terfezia boudieri ATCC MYA-4762]